MNKSTARSRLRDAVRYGHIRKPQKCENCGSKVESKLLGGHHFEGYDKWWSVKWLCVHCHNIMDRASVRHPGVKNGQSKLTPKLVEYAKELRSLGMTYATIASKVGVAYSTLRYAVVGKTWRPE